MTVREPDAILREPVDLGCLVDPAAVRTDGMRGVVIAHNEKNVGWHVSIYRMSRVMRNLISSQTGLGKSNREGIQGAFGNCPTGKMFG